jgi:signal peptidase II
LVLFVLLITVVLDQASKIVIDRLLPLHTSIPVIDNLFSLTYIRNKGAAFGIFAGTSETFRLTFLIVFSLIAIGFVVKLLIHLPRREKALLTALSLILGGAIGNLIDRIAYGEVIDFLDFYWSHYHWPAFNLADSSITVGVVITLWRLMTSKDGDPLALRSDD